MWLPLCSTYLMSWSSSQICIRPISTKANQLHRYRVLVMGRIQVSLECMLTKALGLLSKSMNVCYQQMGYHGVQSTICDSRFGQRNFFQKASPFYLKNETTFGGERQILLLVCILKNRSKWVCVEWLASENEILAHVAHYRHRGLFSHLNQFSILHHACKI